MHEHTLGQSMSTAEYAAIDFSLASWQTRAHSVAFKQQETGMISAHIKPHRSAVTLPLDHLRIVQIDLHKVLLLGIKTIERPERGEKNRHSACEPTSLVTTTHRHSREVLLKQVNN